MPMLHAAVVHGEQAKMTTTMMRSLSLMHALLVMLPLQSRAWLAPIDMFQHTAAAFALTATLMLGSPQQPPMLGKELQSSLQKPTEDRPQIQIPSTLQQTASAVDKNAPIVEGNECC